MYTTIFSCPSCPLYVPRQYSTPETYPINNLLCSGVNNPPSVTQGLVFLYSFLSSFYKLPAIMQEMSLFDSLLHLEEHLHLLFFFFLYVKAYNKLSSTRFLLFFPLP